MIIGIPVYDDVDRLDVAGPYEMFNWMKVAGSAVDVQVIAATDKVTTRDGLTPMSHKTFEQVNGVDVLWVPGGDPSALALMMSDPDSRYLKFLQAMSKTARVVASVCEGACCCWTARRLQGDHPLAVHSLPQAISQDQGRRRPSALRHRPRSYHLWRHFFRPRRIPGLDRALGWARNC